MHATRFLLPLLLIGVLAARAQAQLVPTRIIVDAKDEKGAARINARISELSESVHHGRRNPTWTIVTSRYGFSGKWEPQVGPGTFMLEVQYVGASPPQIRKIGPFELREGDDALHELYFERGRIRLKVDNDTRWTRCNAACMRRYTYYRDGLEMYEWEIVTSRNRFDGKWDVHLAPGTYKLVIDYTGSAPRQTRVIGPFEVKDKARTDYNIAFETGKVSVRVKGRGGAGRVNAAIERLSSREIDGVYEEYWDIVASKYDFDGTWSREVATGLYRVVVEYIDSMPPQIREIGPFEITDNDHVRQDV